MVAGVSAAGQLAKLLESQAQGVALGDSLTRPGSKLNPLAAIAASSVFLISELLTRSKDVL